MGKYYSSKPTCTPWCTTLEKKHVSFKAPLLCFKGGSLWDINCYLYVVTVASMKSACEHARGDNSQNFCAVLVAQWYEFSAVPSWWRSGMKIQCRPGGAVVWIQCRPGAAVLWNSVPSWWLSGMKFIVAQWYENAVLSWWCSKFTTMHPGWSGHS